MYKTDSPCVVGSMTATQEVAAWLALPDPQIMLTNCSEVVNLREGQEVYLPNINTLAVVKRTDDVERTCLVQVRTMCTDEGENACSFAERLSTSNIKDIDECWRNLPSSHKKVCSWHVRV
jgi:hypothetical protein